MYLNNQKKRNLDIFLSKPLFYVRSVPLNMMNITFKLKETLNNQEKINIFYMLYVIYYIFFL